MSRFLPPPPVIRTSTTGKHSYNLEIVVKNKSLENTIRKKLTLIASELLANHSKIITKVEFSKNES